ncbi:MAG TPA: RIP metalloprotease RseP [Candidatus Bipolaricaulota bacterium]|nr:RIP metalloprotease RseP [Candidatus Bipolaricaulota bacterium]
MLLTAIVFIIILSVLVLVHEIGHYFTARKLGVKIEEFGIGFPPKAWGYKSKKTGILYSVNWIPLGGFVKIKGEDGAHKEDKDSFIAQKVWKRFAIIIAGVFMNFVLACVLLSIGFMIGAPQIIDNGDNSALLKNKQVQVYEVSADSPAMDAGLEPGDAILEIDGQALSSSSQVAEIIKTKEGQSVDIKVKRYDETLALSVSPVYFENLGQPGIGVSVVSTAIVSYPWYKSLWLGLKSGTLLTGQIVKGLAIVIKNLVTTGHAGLDVAGPVGIAVLTGQFTRMGIIYVIQFAALLSINLMIINFIPFPALDGGRALFLLIEKLRGKPINQKIENIIHTIGFALLILLIIMITGRDIFKFKDVFANIWNKFVS